MSMQKTSQISHPVVVIGAGLSGLTTAYRLLQQGIDVHVYEARQRVGGRILTVRLNDTNVELGGQNILDGGEAENIQKLITELELKTEEGKIRSQFHYYDGTKLIDIDEALQQSGVISSEERLKKNLKSIVDHSQNMAQVLQSLFASQPELYKLFALRLLGYEGLSVERLSPRYVTTLESMLLSFNDVDEDGHRYFEYMIVKEGNARIAEKLKEKLEGRITLGWPLRSLTKTLNSSYALTFDNGQTVEAERVVLALPCSVYKDIRFDSHDLLHARLPHIKAVGYGEHAKLSVPVHMPENFFGLYANDRFATFSMATPNIVTMYYLDHHASFTPSTIQQIFKQDRSFLEWVYQDRGLSQLQAEYARCEHFTSYHGPVGYNWFDDPYSRGSYSCVAAGQEEVFTATTEYHGEVFKKLFSPIDDRLFFAGEHTSILMDVVGTMEAAVEAGERTARMMVSVI